jgi:hypothetical protein
MNARRRKIIEQFWSQELGIYPSRLDSGPRVFCSAQNLYSGVQLFWHNSRESSQFEAHRVKVEIGSIQEDFLSDSPFGNKALTNV